MNPPDRPLPRRPLVSLESTTPTPTLTRVPPPTAAATTGTGTSDSHSSRFSRWPSSSSRPHAASSSITSSLLSKSAPSQRDCVLRPDLPCESPAATLLPASLPKKRSSSLRAQAPRQPRDSSPASVPPAADADARPRAQPRSRRRLPSSPVPSKAAISVSPATSANATDVYLTTCPKHLPPRRSSSPSPPPQSPLPSRPPPPRGIKAPADPDAFCVKPLGDVEEMCHVLVSFGAVQDRRDRDRERKTSRPLVQRPVRLRRRGDSGVQTTPVSHAAERRR
ncbi:hypothetical protein BROUX41_001355 [Berkeleyomyces rouxiae]|uniref:uncharacterized protein n=1 Tax=Berkeleyomyces rouxiae TaxID=2035830 RepID=UPI003B75E85B